MKVTGRGYADLPSKNLQYSKGKKKLDKLRGFLLPTFFSSPDFTTSTYKKSLPNILSSLREFQHKIVLNQRKKKKKNRDGFL